MTTTLSEEGAHVLALVVTEWFRLARRLSRLTQEAAPARMERERAQLAYALDRIEGCLAGNGLHMVTHDGADYSPQLPAEPVNPEDFGTEEGLVVQETLEPTILLNGRVIVRGRVVLGRGD